MSEQPLIVLVVSVAPENRAALCDALSRDPAARYVVMEADTLARAIELRRERAPDCLILDHDLSDQSLLDALKQLAIDDGLSAFGIVVLVDAGDARLIVELMKSGAHDCLERNRARGEELRRAVSRAIEEADRQQQARSRGRELPKKHRALETARAASRGEAAERKQGEDVRQRMERELRDSHEQLRIVVEAARMGTFDWDIKADRVTGNEQMKNLLGLPPDMKVSNLPFFLQSVLRPEDREAVLQAITRAFDQGEKYHAEFRVNWPDGSLHWLGVEGRVYYDAKKRPARMLGVAMDITERKQAEEALKASEERLDLAMQAGDIGTFDWDVRTNVVVWTEKTKAIFGLPSSTITGMFERWRERVHPEDLPRCEASIQEAFDKKLPDWGAQYRMIRADTGEERWIDSRSRIFYDAQGAPIRMIGTNIDITERKRVEEAMRENEARLQRLADAMPQIVYTCGPDGVVDYVNQQWREYVGLVADQSLGGAMAEAIHPGDRDRAWRQWEKSVGAGQPFETELRMRRRDGQYRWRLSRARPLRNDQGRIVKWIGTSTDIHDRKQAEAEREVLLAREQAAREIAEAANRTKDEFLTVVSHELRTPLNAMLGYARLLRYGSVDDQKVKQVVEIIERSGKAQAQLIDDLLDTAGIISGRLRLDIGPVDLVAVIGEAVQTIYPAADAKGISIQTDLALEVGQITGDPARLRQMIWNLLSNAIKFTPAGGRVEIRLERIDPHVRVRVSDTGIGISSDFLPYIFDRFRQADASSVRRYGGLGLGLSLVKYLVELHGGTIEAMSAGEGKGATFEILLPLRAVFSRLGEAGGGPVAVAGLEDLTMLTGVRALVVDDETEARELVKLSLVQYGADVVGASSAAEAYDLITAMPARERPDVMVTDLGMPDEDGYGLLRRVREWERERGLFTPAVALTAYGRVEDRVRALGAGFQRHIAKPVDPAELAVVVASLVTRLNRNGKR